MKERPLTAPLKILAVFIILYVVRDLMNGLIAYGDARLSGIPPNEVLQFLTHPVAAYQVFIQLFLAGLCFLLLYSLLERRESFRWMFLAYFLLSLTGPAAGFLFAESSEEVTYARDGVIVAAVLMVPWLIYLFTSKRAREVFSRDARDGR